MSDSEEYGKFLKGIVERVEADIQRQRTNDAKRLAHQLVYGIPVQECRKWTRRKVIDGLVVIRLYRRYGEAAKEIARARLAELEEDFGGVGIAYLINEEERGWIHGWADWECGPFFLLPPSSFLEAYNFFEGIVERI